MSRCSGIRRTEAAFLPQQHEVASARSGRAHGGTVGAGTRQGTTRTVAQRLAWDWDALGAQEKALTAAFILWSDAATRARLCQGDGRHPGSGLCLKRPRRASCSATSCDCLADTVAIAGALGVGHADGQQGVRATTASASARHACIASAAALALAPAPAPAPALAPALALRSPCAPARDRPPASFAPRARHAPSRMLGGRTLLRR